MLLNAFAAITSSLNTWRNFTNDSVKAYRQKQEAIQTIMAATLKTKAYLCDLERGASTDRSQEREISLCWQHAATAIREYDSVLSESAEIKALGWADPKEWKRAASRPWAIQLDTIIAQCQWLNKNN